MSAFVCSDKHVLIVAKIIAEICEKPAADVLTIAEELRRENIRSVNYRYRERSRFPKGWETTPDYLTIAGLAPVDCAALIECLDYQSCERPDYAKSHAGKMLTKAKAYFDSIVPTWAKSNIWSI